MLKGTRVQDGGEPRPKYHVTLQEPEGDDQNEEKSILLKKVMLPDESGGESSPVKNGGSSITGSVASGSTGLLGPEEEQDTSCLARTRRLLKVAYKVVKSIAGLLILLIAYSLLGALIFMKIESRTVYEERPDIAAERSQLVGALQRLCEGGTVGGDKWKADVAALLTSHEEAARQAALVPDNSTARQTWDFWNSLFFVGTVYTTIGYGHIAPSTSLGKVVCMFYAAIGIPLALLCLAELGKRFTVALKFLWAFVRRFYYHGRCRKLRKPFNKKYEMSEENPVHQDQEASENKSIGERSRSGSRIIYGYEVDDDFNLPITVAIGIVLVYIVLGAMMYSIWEEWEFIDAIYFVFISISTIGFGDILPAHPKFFMMSFVYLFIGLSLVSMCINVAIEFFSKTVDQAKQKMMDAKHKMEEAKDKIGQKVNQAGKNVKEKAAGIKTNIMDETHKIVKKTDEKFRKRSRSSTPVGQDQPAEGTKPMETHEDDRV